MRELTCIVCPIGCHLEVNLEEKKVSGNKCPRGEKYGIEELTAPKRIITTTVKVKGGIHNRLPVKTTDGVPKEMIFECMKEINKIAVESPVKVRDVLIENILGTGVDVVATRNI